MKNTIHYYYDLSTDHVHQIEKDFYFYVKDEEYYLTRTFLTPEIIDALNQIVLELWNHFIYCHLIIPNKEGKWITIIHEEPYVLLKIFNHSNELLSIYDIENFCKQTKNIKKIPIIARNHWYQLWTSKIDYLEYQINQLGKNHPLIRESFNYYIGMTENAIALQNQLHIKEELSVCRRRIHSNETLFEYENPLNFILDQETRDEAEYFKEKFYSNPYLIEDIKYFLFRNNFTIEEYQSFFIRMLFPTKYFDLFEEILLEGKPESTLLPILEKTNDYENLLRELYLFLKNYLPTIEWLEKRA